MTARRGKGYLAAAGVAVALAASSCASSAGSGAARTTQTVVVTTTAAAATPDPAVATTDDSRVALRQLLSGVSTAKAQLVQYQQDLDALCGGSESKQCWTALHYSKTVGTEISDNLTQISQRPAEVADLWLNTWLTTTALQSLDDRWCAPSRDFNGCYSHVIGTVQKLSQQFAGWDPYLAPPR